MIQNMFKLIPKLIIEKCFDFCRVCYLELESNIFRVSFYGHYSYPYNFFVHLALQISKKKHDSQIMFFN